jgi:hypothetical protein
LTPGSLIPHQQKAEAAHAASVFASSQYPQEIFPDHQFPLPCSHSDLLQFPDKMGDSAAILKTFGTFISGAKIFTEIKSAGNMFNSHHIYHVCRMVRQHFRRLLLRVRMNKRMVHIHADNSTGIPNRTQLIIRQVPSNIA